ncbi:MAG: fumarylacetoacetate hydrolase family protein [Pseudomonadota bacterium]
MESTTTQHASDLIWNAWQNGEVIDGLPDGFVPATRAEGYDIQALLEERTAQPIIGWKIAATSSAGQQHIGVNGPIAGRLLAERTFQEGTVLKFGANRMAVAEPEFAFRFGKAMQPRSQPYTTDEVLASVSDLHLAIEVPDSRFADFVSVGAANLIADNACAHEFVLGPEAPSEWREIDLEKHAMKAEVVGKVQHDGMGSNVLGDPREALTWLVNEVTGLGITLSANQVVTTGTCAVPLPIAAGDHVKMDFGSLGTVETRFDNV